MYSTLWPIAKIFYSLLVTNLGERAVTLAQRQFRALYWGHISTDPRRLAWPSQVVRMRAKKMDSAGC